MGTLGTKLKELRGDLSLYEVGKATGIDRSDIKKYEESKVLPKPSNLKKLAEYYEVPYENLFFPYLSEVYTDSEDRQLIIKWAETIKGSSST